MKLKEYLREQHNMSYAEYKALPDIERWQIEGEFQSHNVALQRRQQARENFVRSGGVIRQATPEELEEWAYRSDLERQHRENSIKAGDISGNGYIALHHRH